MSDLEKTCLELEKTIDNIDIKNYVEDYVLPYSKSQQFLDKLEFHMLMNFYENYDSRKKAWDMEKECFGEILSQPSDHEREIINGWAVRTWGIMNNTYNDYEDIETKAFEMVDKKYPGQFKLGMGNNNFITLIRKKPGSCIVSGKHHDKESSYIFITETSTSHKVSVGCNRGCTFTSKNVKLKGIGSIKK